MDFGRVLGGVWEAKNLDFRTFFDDFSKQILEDVLERQKNEKKSVRRRSAGDFGGGLADVPDPGERKRGGQI